MNKTISKDYCVFLASLSMNQNFAEEFFANPEDVLNGFNLSELEKENLLNISKAQYDNYRATQCRSKDCDSCCNGSSNCFAACCA